MTVVDRILNGFAVCEKDGVSVDIPLNLITGNVSEGDLLRMDEDTGLYCVDSEGTKDRRDALSDRFKRIKAKNKK